MWASGVYGYLCDYLFFWLVFASVLLHTWCFFRLARPTWRPRLRLVLGNLLVGLCLLVGAALAAETWLRFVSITTDAHGQSLTTRRWERAYVRLNSLACRDEEWSRVKPPGTYRIAMVGDSFTYGWGVNDPADRFTDLLEARFNQVRPGAVEVMNVAWAGWDTGAQLKFVDRLLQEYQVDEVVLCYLANDIETLLPPERQSTHNRAPRPVLFNTETSFLADYLYYHVLADRAGGSDYFDNLWDAHMDPGIWGRQQERLEAFIGMCRRHGVMLRFALVPLVMAAGQAYDGESLHERVGGYVAARGVPVVDLWPTIADKARSNLVVNGDDPHPNEEAHRLFAEGIWLAFYARGGPAQGP